MAVDEVLQRMNSIPCLLRRKREKREMLYSGVLHAMLSMPETGSLDGRGWEGRDATLPILLCDFRANRDDEVPKELSDDEPRCAPDCTAARF